MNLSPRLEKIATLVKEGETLLDIGTDHGWLPIELLKTGKIPRAILADVNQGPLDNAKTNLINENLADKAALILADGFDGIKEEYDVTVIAGMGGFTIKEILSNASKLDKRYILQPNNGEYILRSEFKNLNLKIVEEYILKDAAKIYEIIVVEPGSEELTEKQLMFGKFLSETKGDIFNEKWNFEKNYLENILPKINNEEEKANVSKRIATLGEILC